MLLRRIIIAIDGYSACGKSTTAREVARLLGYHYIDSGAMYRAATLYIIEHGIVLDRVDVLREALKGLRIEFRLNSASVSETYLNGRNVENEIRNMKVSSRVSEVSAIKVVRETMVSLQRVHGAGRGVVMDGRDIGTVVFPDAELKLFMTAEMTIRGFRRQRELHERGIRTKLAQVIANIEARDQYDKSRKESPLRKAPDALTLDTTFLAIDEQVDVVVWEALHRILQPF